MEIKYTIEKDKNNNNHNYAYFNSVKFSKKGNYYFALSNNIYSRGLPLHHAVYMLNYDLLIIPKNYDIHHIDMDKNNNNIINLQLMTHGEHKSLHLIGNQYTKGITSSNKGKSLSDETKLKISLNHANTSGKKNGFYGKHHSAETLLKMANTRKKNALLKARQ